MGIYKREVKKEHVNALVRKIKENISQPLRIMEICGGQTHALLKYGIQELLGDKITMIHGPGCPVCVTPQNIIDKAFDLSLEKNIIMTTFGDMARVPGSKGSLLYAKSFGADIRILYSPLDIFQIASENNDKEIVFFSIGFETTAPIHALAIKYAFDNDIQNVSFLTSLVTVPAALKYLLSDRDAEIDGILGAGHVCAVSGYEDYEKLAEEFKVPISITGFEPEELLLGILNCVNLIVKGEHCVINSYPEVVVRKGNEKAIGLINEVFDVFDNNWRGLGVIPKSGLIINKKYEHYNSALRFKISDKDVIINVDCRAGEIMRGKLQPNECSLFGRLCNPDNPQGASMVSSEGACAAYYLYSRNIVNLIGNRKDVLF
ncbi:MAG: hydrogenase formation protein HypD [Bacteroidales bacterium]|nr:hydrogenase formation protein HypD [Bacteroidales bacterium]